MSYDPDFLPARGIMFARKALAIAAGNSADERIAYAARRWGSRSAIVQVLKADVGGHEIGDADFLTSGTNGQAAEFGEIVDLRGLLQGLTPVPSGVPFIGCVTDPAANWVGESKGVPVSRAVLDRTTLRAKKISCLLVLTEELIKSSDPRTELMVLNMMARAARKTANAAIADPANSGDDDTPAAITSAATPISSSGDLADDAQAAIDAYGGSLETAVWWLRPDLAAQAGLRAGANGAGAGLGALGGTLAGLPAYVSEGIPADSSGSPLILVDRASVAVVDEGYAISRSRHGTVEMADNPSGATDTPVTAGTGTKLVSLFQSGAVGLLLVRRVNWSLANPAAVVVVDNCSYAAAP
jgi:HK97 family phage major capsid protein